MIHDTDIYPQKKFSLILKSPEYKTIIIIECITDYNHVSLSLFLTKNRFNKPVAVIPVGTSFDDH